MKEAWNEGEDTIDALARKAKEKGGLSEQALRTWEILTLVNAERRRQDVLVKQGKFSWNCAAPNIPWSEKLAVLMEEVGEAANEVVEWIISRDKYAADPQLLRMPPHREAYFRNRLRTELIQIAAVCVAFAESLNDHGSP